MTITFQNSLGRIDFNGSALRIIQAEGFGMPDCSFSVNSLVGKRGQKTSEKRLLKRVMTISADLTDKRKLDEIIRILSEKGVMTVRRKNKHRQIECYCSDLGEPKRKGNIYSLVFQFTADDPVFSDVNYKSFPIISKTDLIHGSFTLPCIFTSSLKSAEILNRGDLETEPVIIINIIKKGVADNVNLQMNNSDRNAKIQLDFSPSDNQKIEIDTLNAKISDSNGNNLLGLISDDTFLSDFILKKGINNLSSVCDDETLKFCVYAKYKNKYYEVI